MMHAYKEILSYVRLKVLTAVLTTKIQVFTDVTLRGGWVVTNISKDYSTFFFRV
jgi:hypothetical protein